MIRGEWTDSFSDDARGRVMPAVAKRSCRWKMRFIRPMRRLRRSCCSGFGLQIGSLQPFYTPGYAGLRNIVPNATPFMCEYKPSSSIDVSIKSWLLREGVNEFEYHKLSRELGCCLRNNRSEKMMIDIFKRRLRMFDCRWRVGATFVLFS